MRRQIGRFVESIAVRIRGSKISNIPGLYTLYQAISKPFRTEYEEGEQWAEYEGYELKISPPDHVSTKIANQGFYEWDVRNKINDCVDEGDTVLDIGAHIGNHTLTLSNSVGESGQVFALEPDPDNAKFIRDTICHNNIGNVEVIEKALAKSTEKRELNIESGNSGSASLFDDVGEEKVQIETISYKDFIDAYGVDRIDFVKMDIEGAEKELVPNIDFKSIDCLLLELHCKDFLNVSETESLIRLLSDQGDLCQINGRSVIEADDLDLDRNKTLIWQRRK